MSRAAVVFLFLLTIPHVVEARAAGRETATRPVLICENHTRFIDARDCIERPQKQFDVAPVVTSNPFWLNGKQFLPDPGPFDVAVTRSTAVDIGRR